MTLQNRSGSKDETALRLARAVMVEAERRPWLAGVLLRRPDWIERLSQWAAGLHELPRRTRRALLRGTAVAALLLALAGGPAPAYAATLTVGTGTAGSCTEAALNTALTNAVANDTITFNCGGLKTIAVSSTKTVSLANLTIDGGKLITLDGGGTHQVLAVSNYAALILQNITITNGSDIHGGNILNQGTLTVENSAITNSVSGGGIFTDTGTGLTILNSTISGNTASNGGGIYASSSSSMTITNSTISGNTATVDGGGIFVNAYSLATITNSTISGNTAASEGGGIFGNNSYTTVIQSTITNNQANGVASSGGGFANSVGFSSFENTIIAGNTAYGSSHDCNTLQNDNGYNIEGGTSCFGSTPAPGTQQNVLAANLLQPLSLNPTRTGTQTHALKTGSAGVDVIPIGTNGCGTAPRDVDQRGAVRAGQVTLGDHRGGTMCDVGAYEFDSNYPPTTVTLSHLGAQSNVPFGAAGLLGGVLAVLAGAAGWFKLRRAR